VQARGQLFVRPGDPTYGGHIIGEVSRDSLFDMDVNPVKAKKLTNVRANWCGACRVARRALCVSAPPSPHPHPLSPAPAPHHRPQIRAAGNDEAIRLAPPRLFPLEEAVVYVAPDELVEVTPTVIRLRKRLLDPADRDKASRSFAKSMRDK
jgi:GTP-binding protein